MALAKEILPHVRFLRFYCFRYGYYSIIRNDPQTLRGVKETAIIKPIDENLNSPNNVYSPMPVFSYMYILYKENGVHIALTC